MKSSFEIKAKKSLDTLIRDGKFYAKNEFSKVLNFGDKDPYASCWGITINSQAEKNLVVQ
ncbi:hypothetical protein P1X15_23195 [Runella sp. MFBS21]|uniref:hypothetical protein n=1 Tax=Runella sp. MFBS21 TaxID=3034018 RepID=UPI0023F99D8A|nr:hypothetical protein [Runella sp. MFBS21]MDF7820549.1 hypothetical protein [Runella sp. MFBS21]